MAGKRRGSIGCAVAVASVMVLRPAIGRGETRTFIDTTFLFPVGGAQSEGPASDYPSTIEVAGVAGTVTGVRVTLFGYTSSSPDDADVGITGPNGKTVMLMSDACGESSGMTLSTTEADTWTFDDTAPTYVSNNGPCPIFNEQNFKPSNYLGNDPQDDFSQAPGGPPPPYENTLSALAGGSPNGSWKLFMFDDNGIGYSGFQIDGWALSLDVDPPAPPSNDFTIGTLDGQRLGVDVPAPGTIVVFEATDTGLIKTTSVSGGPGTVAVDLQLTKPGKRKLRSAGKVKFDAGVSFIPYGGTANTKTTSLRIKK